jgi:hypothetical protein
MQHYWCTSAIILSLVTGVSPAVAQSPAPEPQQRTQQENWQHTPSGQMGKEEPSSHAPSAKPMDNAALVNGALAVPGAPQNSETVPAKFSEKNAADDKLVTVAYTFKTLSPEQRRAIYQGLKDQAPAQSVVSALASELPIEVTLQSVPEAVAAQVPQIRGYQYIVLADQVLLVSPATRIVVGALSDAG